MAKTAYLTFDDGPHRDWTPQVLDVLRRHDVRATFFVIGACAEEHAALVRRAVRERHAVANHTYSHVDLTRLSAAEFVAEVTAAARVIDRITGRTTRLLRPPWGRADGTTRTLARRNGHRLVRWNVDPQDWRRPGVTSIAASVIANTRDGDVILLHDGGVDRSQTVAALDELLGAMHAAGYRFETMR